MIGWETVRDAYLERFGSLVDASYVYDRHVENKLFWELEFTGGSGPFERRTINASFGAVYFPAAAEVFVVSAAPFGVADELFTRVGCAASPLAPFQVLPQPTYGTHFTAMLLLPPGDGSFLLGEAGGRACYAFQAVPITQPEWSLAQDQPQKALDLLRHAGAFVFDPLRDCLLAPERHAPREVRRAVLLDRTRRSLATAWSFIGYFRGIGAPDVMARGSELIIFHRRAVLRHFGEPDRPVWDDLVPIELPDSDPLACTVSTSSEALERIDEEALAHRGPPDVVTLVRDALDFFRHLLPLTEQRFFAEFLAEMLATHPDWSSILAAAGPRDAGTEGPPAFPEQAIDRLADMIRRFHPQEQLERLRARGFVGSVRGETTFDRTGEVSYANHVWSCIHEEMFKGIVGSGSLQARALESALESGRDTAKQRWAHEPSEPGHQIVNRCRYVVSWMFKAFADVITGSDATDLDEP